MKWERIPFRHGNDNPAKRTIVPKVGPADAALVRALADLAESTEPKRRAQHLVKPAREFAKRIDRLVPPEAESDTQKFPA